jgi:hypothetical protein
MFDAVNAIDGRYRQFLVDLMAAPRTSREAAAAVAAATLLSALHPEVGSDIEAMLTSYLGSIAEGQSKAEGVKLGEVVAKTVLLARESDGATAPDGYRPNTKPGAYIPTPVAVVGVGHHEAVRFGNAVTIPAWPSSGTRQQRMGCRLQRDQDLWGQDER